MPVTWNYGYCEGNKEARVLFRNSGSTTDETVVSTSPPVKWETEIIPGAAAPFGGAGQCCNGNYFVYLDVNRGSGWIANGGGRINCQGKFIGITLTHPNSQTNLWSYQFQSCTGVVTTTSFASGSTSLFYRVNRIERYDGKPDNCAPPTVDQCKFTITDKSGIIYTQIRDYCPSNVRVNCGKKCPPGTCECRNGNTVCCYGSNGIVVTSFTA